MSSELQALVDDLAARLRRGIAINDAAQRLLVFTPQHGSLDPARIALILNRRPTPEILAYVRKLRLELGDSPATVFRLKPEPTLDLLARVAAPLRVDGEFLGALIVIDEEESVTEAELLQIAEAARLAATIVIKDRLLKDHRAARDRALLADLVSDDVELSQAAAETIGSTYSDFGRASRAMLVSVTPNVTTDQLTVQFDAALERSARQVLGRQFLHLTQPENALLLTTEPAGSPIDSPLAEKLREHLSKSLGSDEIRIGVGRLATSVEQLRASYEQARHALGVATRVRGYGPLAFWDDLGIYQLLVRLPDPVLRQGAVPDSLLPLLKRSSGRSLAHTVEVYLDNACDARETIGILRTHRTTLYYRLGRFTELTGLDLNNGHDRLAVHLGLKVARLTGLW